MSAIDLARAEIRALQPYSSARMEADGRQSPQSDGSPQGDARVWLNANESAWAPTGDHGAANHRYPEPQPPALIAALADVYGVRLDQLLVSRGSDEAIDLLVRAFCRAGRDAVLIQPPTFGMYAVCARIQDADVIEVPLAADFSLDVDAVLAAVTPAVKLVFVCTPNNPVGRVVPRAQIERLVQSLAGRALLVVDEAYVEFADGGSVVNLIERYDHLVVLRTLSKAWALAGARIGTLLAHAEVVALLRKLMSPYPLPQPSVDAALLALSGWGRANTRQRVALVRGERERVRAALQRVPDVRDVLPSQANFVAVRFADASAVYQRLLEAGIVVRDVRRYAGLGDALRITIGTVEENDRLLTVLQGDVT